LFAPAHAPAHTRPRRLPCSCNTVFVLLLAHAA
jgi:hypothetical protein